MQTLIGLLIAFLGIFASIYRVKKMDQRAARMPKSEPVRPVPIEDAVASLDSLLKTDPSAHLRVELYGLARTDSAARAPFTERPAVYYQSRSFAVRDREKPEAVGRKRFPSRKTGEQQELYSECGPGGFYILDSTSDEKIYVDMKDFGEKAELVPVCDSYEKENSGWIERHRKTCSRFFSRVSGPVAGFHLLESFYRPDQPLYVLGDLYRMGRNYRVCPSSGEGLRSAVTYRSEEQETLLLRRARQSALGLGLISVAVGLGIIIAGFR